MTSEEFSPAVLGAGTPWPREDWQRAYDLVADDGRLDWPDVVRVGIGTGYGPGAAGVLLALLAHGWEPNAQDPEKCPRTGNPKRFCCVGRPGDPGAMTTADLMRYGEPLPQIVITVAGHHDLDPHDLMDAVEDDGWEAHDRGFGEKVLAEGRYLRDLGRVEAVIKRFVAEQTEILAAELSKLDVDDPDRWRVRIEVDLDIRDEP